MRSRSGSSAPGAHSTASGVRGVLELKHMAGASTRAGAIRDGWESLYCVFDRPSGTLEAFESDDSSSATLYSWRICYHGAPQSVHGTFIGSPSPVRDVPNRPLKRKNRFDLNVITAATGSSVLATDTWLELSAPDPASKVIWVQGLSDTAPAGPELEPVHVPSPTPAPAPITVPAPASALTPEPVVSAEWPDDRQYSETIRSSYSDQNHDAGRQSADDGIFANGPGMPEERGKDGIVGCDDFEQLLKGRSNGETRVAQYGMIDIDTPKDSETDGVTAVAVSRSGCTIVFADYYNVYVRSFSANNGRVTPKNKECNFSFYHRCMEQEGKGSVHVAAADQNCTDAKDSHGTSAIAAWTSGEKVQCVMKSHHQLEKDVHQSYNVESNDGDEPMKEVANEASGEQGETKTITALALSEDGALISYAVDGRTKVMQYNMKRQEWECKHELHTKDLKHKPKEVVQLSLGSDEQHVYLAVCYTSDDSPEGGEPEHESRLAVFQCDKDPRRRMLFNLSHPVIAREKGKEKHILACLARARADASVQLVYAVTDSDESCTTIWAKSKQDEDHGVPGRVARCCERLLRASAPSFDESNAGHGWVVDSVFEVPNCVLSLDVTTCSGSNQVALGCANGDIHVYDVNTGVALRAFGSNMPVVSVALCAGEECKPGWRVASACSEPYLEVRGSHGGVAENSMIAHELSLPADMGSRLTGNDIKNHDASYALSADGTTLAVMQENGCVAIADLRQQFTGDGPDIPTVETGEEFSLLADERNIQGFSLSADGSILNVQFGEDENCRGRFGLLMVVKKGGYIVQSESEIDMYEVRKKPDSDSDQDRHDKLLYVTMPTHEQHKYDPKLRIQNEAPECSLLIMKDFEGDPDDRTYVHLLQEGKNQMPYTVFASKKKTKSLSAVLSADKTKCCIVTHKDVILIKLAGSLARLHQNIRRGLETQKDKFDCTSVHKEQRILIGTYRHPTVVKCVAFAPDGTRLVSGSEDGSVRVYAVKSIDNTSDRDTLEHIYTYHAKGKIIHVALSHDNRVLASCSERKQRHMSGADSHPDIVMHDLSAHESNQKTDTERTAPVILPASAVELNFSTQERHELIAAKDVKAIAFTFSRDEDSALGNGPVSNFLVISTRLRVFICDLGYGKFIPPSPVDLLTLAQQYPDTARHVLAKWPSAIQTTEKTIAYSAKSSERQTGAAQTALQNCLLPAKFCCGQVKLTDDASAAALEVLVQHHTYDESGKITSSWARPNSNQDYCGMFGQKTSSPMWLACNGGGEEPGQMWPMCLDMLAQFAAKRCAPPARNVSDVIAGLADKQPAILTRLLHQIGLDDGDGGALVKRSNQHVRATQARLRGEALLGSSHCGAWQQFAWILSDDEQVLDIDTVSELDPCPSTHVNGNKFATSPLWDFWQRLSASLPEDAESVSVKVVGLKSVACNRKFLDNLAKCTHLPLFGTDAVKAVLEYQWRTRHFGFNLTMMGLFSVLLTCFVCWLYYVHGNPDTANDLHGIAGLFAAISILISGIFLLLEVFEIVGMFRRNRKNLDDCDRAAEAQFGDDGTHDNNRIGGTRDSNEQDMFVDEQRPVSYSHAQSELEIADGNTSRDARPRSTPVQGRKCLCVASCAHKPVWLEAIWTTGVEYVTSGWDIIELFCYLLIIFLCFVWYLQNGARPSRGMSALAALLSFVKFLGYLRSFRPLGAFVGSLAQVALDMRPFLLILFIFLLGFGTSFNALGTFDLLNMSYYSTFFLGIGAEDYNDDFTELGWWAMVMQIAAILVIVIVLMNLLIAIVSDSFAKVCEVESLWFQRERAQIISTNNNTIETLAKLFNIKTLEDDSNVTWLHVLQVKENDRAADNETDAWDPGSAQKRLQSSAFAKLAKLDRELQGLNKVMQFTLRQNSGTQKKGSSMHTRNEKA